MSGRPRSRSMSDLMRSRVHHMGEPVHVLHGQRLGEIVFRAASSNNEATMTYLANLPRLTEKELVAIGQADACCPICLNPFTTILTEEEMALAMDTPAHPIEDLGVTRIGSCGHVFCRKDISNWLSQAHNTCPSCRSVLIDLPAPADTLTEQVNALQRHMEASLAAYNSSGGALNSSQNMLPLTPDQLASLHSAIMLFQQGDVEDFEISPEPVDVQAHLVGQERRDDGLLREDDDRDDESFRGMYS